MKSIQDWFQSRIFQMQLFVFVIITLPAIPLYFAAHNNENFWVIILIALVIFGNLIELILP
jgi:predicted ABC-type exoprotein transport system permease subunit